MKASKNNRTQPQIFNKAKAWALGLVLLFSLSIALRLAVLAQSRGTVAFETPVLDSRFYLEAGQQIAQGSNPSNRPYFMNPGYIWTVALFSRIFDDPKLPLLIFQIIIDSLTCLLTAVLTRRLFGQLAGLAAGTLLAANGYQILSATRILPETIAAFLLVVFVIILVRTTEKPAGMRLFFSGTLLGLLSLLRTNALLIILFAFAFFAITWRKDRLAKTAQRILLFATGVAIIIAPVTIRNVTAGKDRVLIASSGGVNFYLGNVTESDGRFISLNQLPLAPGQFDDDPSGGRFERTIQAFAEKQEGRPLKPSEVSAFWMRRGLKEIFDHPTDWIFLLFRKTFLFFNSFEIPQIDNLYFLKQYVPILKPLSFISRILWPLTLFGFLFLLKKPSHSSALLLVFIGYAISVILFFVTARHRLPVVPLAACFAGWAISLFVVQIRKWESKPLFLKGTVLAVCGIVANLNPAVGQWVPLESEASAQSWFSPSAEYLDFPSQYNNMAALLLEKGEFVGAETECRRGLAFKPYHPTLLYNLGRALVAEQKYSEAGQVLEQSLNFQPNNAEVAALLGETRYKAGDLKGARDALERAVSLSPALAGAWNTLGPTRFQSGDTVGALQALQEAERLAPGWYQPCYNKAILLTRLKRYREALAVLDSLSLLYPANREVTLALANSLVGAGQFSRADKILNDLIAKHPDDLGALLTLAELNLNRGEKTQARVFVLRALSINPQSRRALDLLRETTK